jgi:hypothetical protein
VETMAQDPIALATEKANDQHYEVSAAFFEQVLGKHLKYSSGLWNPGVISLDQAEADMLAITAERAGLADGMDVLELGCGWGSLTLWNAAHYPNSRIAAVSNSASQRRFIEHRCREQGLDNVQVITAVMNHFSIDQRDDAQRRPDFQFQATPRGGRTLAGQWQPLSQNGRCLAGQYGRPERFNHSDHGRCLWRNGCRIVVSTLADLFHGLQ